MQKTSSKLNKRIQSAYFYSNKVKSLSTQKKLIEIIDLYQRHSITFDELLQIMEKIRHSDDYKSLPRNLKIIIEEICSLSVVSDIIKDILLELIEL
ncbi:MAG TPA: hypothetical protein VLF93_01955 [Candidatus Saccharimonadales bacterium]|nr:hypothetical protein [Candidatus Saccharimonadales bacterium]